jgi:phosphoglycerate dehydrogenase-like enzyme
MSLRDNGAAHVLFLPPGPSQMIPWFNDVVESIHPRHTLTIFDENLDLQSQFADVDVVIDFGGKLGTHEMADLAAGRVRLWQILGTGFDHFDVAYWNAQSIPVANCPGYLSSPALGDCALMFMLMLARRWHSSQQHLRRGDLYNPVCSELEGKTLGLIGFGSSARELALKVRPFRMRTLAIDIVDIPPADCDSFGLAFAGNPSDIDHVIAQSDFVSLHLHLNPDTHHLIDARRIGLMKPTACLINVARGALVDEAALLSALRERRIGGAGLDVFASEPLPPDSPFLRLDNVVATPHIAGVTEGTSKRRAAFAAANIERIVAGLEPLSTVTRDAAPGHERDGIEVSAS